MLPKKAKTKMRKAIGLDGDDKDEQAINEEEVKAMEMQDDARAEQKVAIDEQTLERIRNMTKEQAEVEDRDIAEGVRLFFDNQYSESEQMYAKKASYEPFAALAHGVMQLIRAVLSFTKEDMDLAAQRLSYAERVANTICPADGYLTSMAKMIRIKGKKKWTNSQLRANMIKALANALFATTLLVQESMVHYVRAGLALRKSYNKLAECEAELTGHENDYDRNCVGCIYIAVGMVNIALSTMPQKIQKLLSIVGYPCNRAKGFELLEKSVATSSYASPMAQTVLVVHRGCIPAVAPILLPEELPKALVTMADIRKQYPKSCIHLHMAGRIARVQRDTEGARNLFELASEEQKELEQLKHLVIYDLAWSDLVEFKLQDAADRFGLLAQENKWSKCFYTYLQASALEMLGERDRAIELYKAAPALSVHKFGGKRMPIEQFVLRRVAGFEEDGFATILPALEAMVLSNMYCQTSLACLDRWRVLAEEKLAEMTSKGDQDPERLCVIWFLLATLYKELNRFDEACDLFKKIYDISDDIEENTHVVPFSLFEHGCMLANRGKETGSLAMLKEAQEMLTAAKDDYKDYNYEIRLGFKVLLSLPLVNSWISQLKKTTK